MESRGCSSPENISKSKHLSLVDEDVDDVDEMNGDFFACYLLTSLCPRFKGHTYIGFTVNPRRRIRQHNGEIGCGAWRTKSKRPWEMVCCIYGFPANVSALQFEWAWQHPIESLSVRNEAVKFKSLSGIQNKIKLAVTMLNIPTWNSLNLTLNFFSTKYTKYYSSRPSLPTQMKLVISPIDDLPCYSSEYVSEEDDEPTEAAFCVSEVDGFPQSLCKEKREPGDHNHHNSTHSSFSTPQPSPCRDIGGGGSEAAEKEETNKKMEFALEKQVEVINIFSPSPPDFINVSSSPSLVKEKRRKHLPPSSNIIIDLTNSPLSFQL